MRRAALLLLLAACSPGAPRAAALAAPAAPGDSAAPLPPTAAPAAPAASAPPPTELSPPVGEPFASSPACSVDAACGWARCNTQAGRCAFPCVRDAECVEGARCQPAPGNAEVMVCTAPL